MLPAAPQDGLPSTTSLTNHECHPPPHPPLQAVFKDARRKASWAGRPWDPAMPPELFGPWRDPWPTCVRGDPVRCYDEVSAARGGLGRFPGSQVLMLVKQFAGVTPLGAAGAGQSAGP